MMILKWGMRGDEVTRLQQRLAELNYYTGTVDGIFGPLTRNAVRAFQHDKGLAVDGIVGPATWAALAIGEPAAPGETPAGSAISLHIGVNEVDPSRYGGWDGALAGCENDARTMLAIAQLEGFTASTLMTSEATTGGVLGAIRRAAEQLEPGGTFLLSYAGHGGQVPNDSADIEDDQQDETWVLFDRQLIDDEIEQALAAFRPGVNIVMLSDSCHSGTVYRSMSDPVQAAYAELKQEYYADLAVPRAAFGDADPLSSFPRPARLSRASGAARFGGPEGDAEPMAGAVRFPGQGRAQRGVAVLDRVEAPAGADQGQAVRTRNLPLAINQIANQIQAEQLRTAKIGARSRGGVQAAGLLISGCQDSQLSQEVGGAGVFTTVLKRTWAERGFTGSYEAFHQAVVSQMGPTQTPKLSGFGQGADTLIARTPFRI